jgi:hypothetical protein
MEISCKELFDMFLIAGGKINCNYEDKKCTYFNINQSLNKVCYLDEKNINYFIPLINDIKHNYIKKIKNTEINNITFHQNWTSKNTIGMNIKFSEDKEGFIIKKNRFF